MPCVQGGGGEGKLFSFVCVRIIWTTPYGVFYSDCLARCSSVVRAFAHGAMGRRIDPSWWTHRSISRSSQCSTTGVTKAVVGVILSVG